MGVLEHHPIDLQFFFSLMHSVDNRYLSEKGFFLISKKKVKGKGKGKG